MQTIKTKRFTDATVSRLGAGERLADGRNLIAQRRTANGKITFLLQARVSETGKQRTYTLGHYPEMNVDAARALATKYRAWIADGHDPTIRRVDERRQAARADDSLRVTFADYVDLYLRSRDLRENSRYQYAVLMRTVSKTLQDKPIRSITQADIEECFAREIARGKAEQAKAWGRIVKVILKDATRRLAPDGQHYLSANPADIFDINEIKLRTRQRNAYLTLDELQTVLPAAFNRVFRSAERPTFGLVSQHHAMQLLTYTGLRLNEVLTMKVTDLFRAGDRNGNRIIQSDFIRVRVQKRKRGNAGIEYLYLPLTPMLRIIIANQMFARAVWFQQNPTRQVSDYLFPSPRDEDGPLRGVQAMVAIWQEVLEDGRTGYDWAKHSEDNTDKSGRLSAHWLRHSWVTTASDIGFSIGEIDLAHGKQRFSGSSTEGYRHQTLNPESLANRLVPILNRVQLTIRDYGLIEEFEVAEASGAAAAAIARETATADANWRLADVLVSRKGIELLDQRPRGQTMASILAHEFEVEWRGWLDAMSLQDEFDDAMRTGDYRLFVLHFPSGKGAIADPYDIEETDKPTEAEIIAELADAAAR